jgi:thiamine-monophosphate kinase
MVCGAIGDGWLGLKAARGEIADENGSLARRYRLPMPLLALREALRTHVRAAADVSDGLLADAGHIGEASGLAVAIDLARAPLSIEGEAWRARQSNGTAARLKLSIGGDDYAIVCAVAPADRDAFATAVASLDVPVATIGAFSKGAGLTVTDGGAPVIVSRVGWRH